MRWNLAFGALLSLTMAAVGAEPPKKGLVVHEWGVFRVNTDAEFANAEMRAEWDELPEFIYGHIKGRVVPQHWGAVEIRRKPIVFFHATEATTVRVKVEFPGGLAGVWYPATTNPVLEGNGKQPSATRVLEWQLAIKQCPPNWRLKLPNAPAVSDRHWISRIRQVKSDEIFSLYDPNRQNVEREKFLYYDGIFPQGKWLKIVVEKDKVALTSQVKHPVFDVTVVDRRHGKLRVGRIAKIEAGESISELKFADADASSFSSEAAATLVAQITTAGLYEDEARSLTDLWKKELFETPGLNLFYRLPQTVYDVRLSLTITPKPESTVRVGLVHHAHLETDFAEQILELVRQLDSPRFNVRHTAVKKLHQIGSAALVELQRIQARKELSVEVREKIDMLVKKWNARDGFDIPKQ